MSEPVQWEGSKLVECTCLEEVERREEGGSLGCYGIE